MKLIMVSIAAVMLGGCTTAEQAEFQQAMSALLIGAAHGISQGSAQATPRYSPSPTLPGADENIARMQAQMRENELRRQRIMQMDTRQLVDYSRSQGGYAQGRTGNMECNAIPKPKNRLCGYN